VCGVVGIKPTVGLISRTGIIPISHTQDTAGPMARTVSDAAYLLSALVGADPDDPATAEAKPLDYTKFLDRDGLKGARIGIARRYFSGTERVDKIINEAIAVLQQQGAELVDPLPAENLGRYGQAESTVLSYEFKDGINKYLSHLTGNFAIKSLKDLIAFNEKNADKELPYFGQETFIRAEARGPLTDKEYLDALERCRRLSRAEGIDALMDKHQLDAIVAPSGGPANATDLIYGNRGLGGCSGPAAVAGYPHITVPAGYVHGLPIGLSFFGRAWSEPTLIRLAFAFEQATKHRRPPEYRAGI
jgi:amidase